MTSGLLLPSARCRVMGVLNVTPDSFSDGGLHVDPDAAVAAGVLMAELGADVIDVGGESTRPGAEPVAVDVELARVVPVVKGLSERGVTVSIDTTKAEVAEQALDAGAVMVNDVSCARDAAVLEVVARRGVPYVLMHNRGPSATMLEQAVYHDVVAEVCAELLAGLDRVRAAGIDQSVVILDPGLGFAKQAEHNWALLAALPALAAIGCPVLIGASRKSFLGALLADASGTARPVDSREDATQAITAIVAREGAWGVRVHDVGPASDAARVVTAVAAHERSRS